MTSILIDDWLDKVLEASRLTVDHRFKKWARFVIDCDMDEEDKGMFEGAYIPPGPFLVETGWHRLILACAVSGTKRHHYAKYRVLIMKPDATLELTDIYTDDSSPGWALRLQAPICMLLEQLKLRDQGIASPYDTILRAAEGFEAALSRIPEDKWLQWYAWLFENKDDAFLKSVVAMLNERLELGEW
ncbi:MAG: hypothetical protein JSV16_09035 [Candidatus Hydrogenedentota bacterium]|nr:MAG: hypothetical protein JSV16_09035 [Candidatus Hydrogenedentota bacterium]